jgi:hypothetical protein
VECAAFPLASHDDQVDAMSQALRYWFSGLVHEAPESSRRWTDKREEPPTFPDWSEDFV